MTSIAWQPWGEAAFAAARAADKPVLLSISAVWCHWCHVMDRTSYSDPTVIDTIGERFIPIRVDNDLRPDVNSRYNQGGWPTTAFLTPDGDLIAGATYLPPAHMAAALENVANFYRDHRAEIAQRADRIRLQALSDMPQRGALRESVIATTRGAIERAYDVEHAGFGETQKFPMTDVLAFLWLEYRCSGEQTLYDMLARTVLAMAQGGMYDHVEGGFFRYSTTPDWSIPHFEKMAEDHAGLIRLLADLWRTTRNPKFHETLRSCVQYVRTTLRDPQTGLFAGSQDADEEYYALPLAERRARAAPFVDRRSYTNWSAALAAAMLAAADALEDERIAAESLDALRYIHERLRDADGFVMHVRTPGEAPSIHGLLTDQTAYLGALIDAHEIAGDDAMLRAAATLADGILSAFADESGALRDHIAREGAVAALARPEYPLRENALTADALLRLSVLCEDARYHEGAIRILEASAARAERYGLFAAPYAAALRRALGTPLRAELRAPSLSQSAALRETLRALPDPMLTVRTVIAGNAPPHVLLCRGTICGPPATTPAAIHATYEGLAQA